MLTFLSVANTKELKVFFEWTFFQAQTYPSCMIELKGS